jgi:hypothetical protein
MIRRLAPDTNAPANPDAQKKIDDIAKILGLKPGAMIDDVVSALRDLAEPAAEDQAALRRMTPAQKKLCAEQRCRPSVFMKLHDQFVSKARR